jgi:cytochrome bd-type quinol oxidase subunit 1
MWRVAMTLGFTALELARIQFAFTVSFHIIFLRFLLDWQVFLLFWNGDGLEQTSLFIMIYSNSG